MDVLASLTVNTPPAGYKFISRNATLNTTKESVLLDIKHDGHTITNGCSDSDFEQGLCRFTLELQVGLHYSAGSKSRACICIHVCVRLCFYVYVYVCARVVLCYVCVMQALADVRLTHYIVDSVDAFTTMSDFSTSFVRRLMSQDEEEQDKQQEENFWDEFYRYCTS